MKNKPNWIIRLYSCFRSSWVYDVDESIIINITWKSTLGLTRAWKIWNKHYLSYLFSSTARSFCVILSSSCFIVFAVLVEAIPRWQIPGSQRLYSTLQRAVYYTSPQSFIITFSYFWLNNFEDFLLNFLLF